MSPPLMRCGHAANSEVTAMGGMRFDPPVPGCVICDCVEVDPFQADLTGRKAICKDCNRERDSSTNLAFFEYRGAPEVTNWCTCGHHRRDHPNNGACTKEHTELLRDDSGVRHVVTPCSCEQLSPRIDPPKDTDTFYCGCRGWS